jgi:PAS domain S-box-containing protein
MKKLLRILYLEDNENDALLAQSALEQEGFECRINRVETRDDFAAALERGTYDLIFSDFTLPSYDGESALNLVTEKGVDIPFIYVSGTIGEGPAIESLLHGATDYVLKGTLSRLVPSVRRALRESEERRNRMRIQQSLKDSEERFRILFDSAPDAYFLTDEKGTCVDGNKAAERLSGYERNELKGKNFLSLHLLRDSDVERAARNLAQSAKGEPVETGEITLERMDGEPVSVEIRILPVTIHDEKLILVIARDVTDRKRSQELVLQSEQRFRQLFDEAPVGYHELDDQGRIIHVNLTELEMLGFRADEMLQHYPREFIVESESSRNAVGALLAGSMPEGTTAERTFRRKDGTLLDVLIMNRTLRNKDGKVVGLRSALQDITGRKKADEELRLLAQTVASARDCITITDLENRLIFVNNAIQDTYGYSAEELVGRDVSILRPPQAPVAITDQILRDSLAGGWHGEIMNRRKDGSDFPVELWTSLVRDEAGIPVAMVGVARDITERKNADAHLRQSEQQFRLIAENVADMIAVVGPDGRRLYNSPSYKSILGDPESLIGTDGFREIHPDDLARVKQVFEQTVQTGIGHQLEYKFLLKDGSERNIESKGTVIKDEEGKISQVIVVSRDVTEEKRLAAQFLRAQRMESIGTLASGIAHDLNNVLAPILMAIEILTKKVSDEGGQRILSTIETSARRGADIVRQVLAFGRGLKGDHILVQLKHIVNEVVKIAGETFPKSIEIKTDIPRDLWTVSADATQMHQVFLNLMVNARDAMPGGGTLTISAENMTLDENYSRMQPDAKPGTYVCIVITDTGTGIPADIRERIFEPFFTTKEIGMGTGLGLSTTLAIVKSHEGFIKLSSKSGKGTTFRIYLPATGTDSGGAAASGVVDLPMGHGELILVIDDEAAIREITKETLEAYGYKTLTASDGAEGVSVFVENKKNIKAVITDMMMPVMDGKTAIIALKRINPDVKIIAASGLNVRGEITFPSDLNVQAFLRKPYTAEKLLRALAEVLS